MAALPRIRSTIVGLGGISFEHLEKLGRLPDVEVAGVCDLSPTLVDAVAERFGVAGRYTSYEDMLTELEPDSVHVLTPPQTHRQLVLGALDAGAHVLVEKPAAPTWDEYAEMRDRAAECGLLMLENLNYRTMPVVAGIVAARDDGRLGEIVNVDVSMGLGLADPGSPYLDRESRHFAHDLPGGALQNFASHPASVVAALLGAPRAVRTSLRQLNPDSLGPDELRALVDAEHGSATVTLTSHGKPPAFTVRVQGSSATLAGDVFAGRVEVERAGSPLTRISAGVRNAAAQLGATGALVTRTATGRNYWYVGFEDLLAGFYDAVAGRGELPVSVSEMDATNRLVAELFNPENRL
jgi:predicted dehydrogenase